MDFAERYGTWAVIAGASEGVGSAFAEEVARAGCNVVLLARRQHLLEEVADRIHQETGVDTRAVGIDLSQPGAAAGVIDATAELDVGLLLYNAGADADY